MLWPKEAGKYIAERAKDVYILEKGVKSCAKIMADKAQEGKLDFQAFKQNEVLPKDENLTKEQLVNWTFLVDTLNFNFWTKKGAPKFTVNYKGQARRGYLGMINAVNKAIQEGKPMYDPKYYSNLNVDDMRAIFRSDTKSQIPLLEERIKSAHEVGKILVDRYNGSFQPVLEKANGSAMKLVDIVTSEFPCFRDVHFYEGKEVAIFKRAQILAADLALLFTDEDPEFFSDLDELSMFADYRVPQSLVHFGVISYSKELLEKLNNEHLFKTGDREEVEIRGVSIHATELIAQETRKILHERHLSNISINSIKVDYFLWDYRVQHARELEHIPYHKTRCIYY